MEHSTGEICDKDEAYKVRGAAKLQLLIEILLKFESGSLIMWCLLLMVFVFYYDPYPGTRTQVLINNDSSVSSGWGVEIKGLMALERLQEARYKSRETASPTYLFFMLGSCWLNVQ